MKGLNKSIMMYILSAIFFTLFAVALTVVLTMNLINNNIRRAYEDHGLIIDFEPKITRRLEKLNDIDGLKLENDNKVNITNNSGSPKKYKILLSPINDNSKDIRVSINGRLIRVLDNFEKEDNNYVLYSGEIGAGYSSLFQIGMWQTAESEIKTLSVDFQINVKIIDE